MSEAQQSPLAIEALIAGRLRGPQADPCRTCPAQRLQKLSKGLRRLESVREGSFDGQEWFLGQLPEALEVPPATVKQAVEDTRRYLARGTGSGVAGSLQTPCGHPYRAQTPGADIRSRHYRPGAAPADRLRS